MIDKTYKVHSMDCPSCAMLIESELEDIGVKANCSYAKSELKVEFDEKKIKEEKVKEIVQKTGYSVSE